MLISTSVCKDHLEPSVACAVHHQLGLPSSCMNFDIGNACLGFMNAMHLAATMIDAGTIEYALIVDGEGSRYTQEATIERLRQPETATITDVFDEFASLTLGSGAAAMVLGQHRPSPRGAPHRRRRRPRRHQHNLLCVGSLDRMTTDTAALLVAGLDLAEEAWKDCDRRLRLGRAADWYILHQVSKVHTTHAVRAPRHRPTDKVPLTYPKYGNVGPAAVPITLAGVQDQIQPGERVLCMGIGSGLNTSATEIVW